MARKERQIRLGLAVATAIGVASLGGGVLLAATQGHALITLSPNPDKNCTGHNGSSTVPAQPGDTITCTIYFNGTAEVAGGFNVQPQAGTTITACSPTFSGTDAAGDPYTTTGAVASNQCHFTIATAGGAMNPGMQVVGSPTQNGGLGTELGTETFTIPATATTPETIMQMGNFCQVEATSTNCGPFGPMGEGGAGTCVGAAANPFPIGGCQGGLPGGITPTPTPTPSGGGSETPTPTSTSESSSEASSEAAAGSSSSVQAASTATKFTSGPDHPFPLGATGIAAGGMLLALAAGAGPSLIRRRRQHRSES